MLDANSLETNILVTVLVLVMVVVLPWLDRIIFGRLGVNLHGGVSTNPRAPGLLRLRQGILTAGFLLYLVIFAWLVFFSRTATSGYSVHVAPLEDLKNAFETEHGFSDVFSRLFTEGFSAFANVKLVRPEDIAQFYMNLMMFVPLGYLFPYVFRWFRERVNTRPVIMCFLISFLTENLQLMSRRGLYDLDDLISNTLGGFIGQLLYISLAYVITQPSWRRELKAFRLWRRGARKLPLYRSRRRIGSNRTLLLASDREAVWHFYVRTLGYAPVRMLSNQNGPQVAFLLWLGASRLEIRCGYAPESLPPQSLIISAAGLDRIRERLLQAGIPTGPYETDPYTGLKALRFTGPDNVQILMIEDE